MRADAYDWGMNVYFTAPGQDYNRTVGMCGIIIVRSKFAYHSGNNNGNPNDDFIQYVNTDQSTLYPEQRMGSRQDLWNWFPDQSVCQRHVLGF